MKRLLLGESIATQDEHHERLSIPAGLAIFASDALSSSAYATEEILLIFIVASHMPVLWGNILAIPIAVSIFGLLAIVVLSYRELIRAYPGGGGAYVVAIENLGDMPGLVVGAALLLDYILTVAVSITAGVAALTSAFPKLLPYGVPLCLVFIAMMTYANLRGLKESARVFAMPTYLFIAGMAGMIVWGVLRVLLGFDPLYNPADVSVTVGTAQHISIAAVGGMI
ncbi:MAG: APC family permease, partial [Cyanobacteria bacterium HKST-UBA06]|nr:APC family permease [Cyanobacteria bacterium HKST-UBA06]